jgi:hypothetical protein
MRRKTKSVIKKRKRAKIGQIMSILESYPIHLFKSMRVEFEIFYLLFSLTCWLDSNAVTMTVPGDDIACFSL